MLHLNKANICLHIFSLKSYAKQSNLCGTLMSAALYLVATFQQNCSTSCSMLCSTYKLWSLFSTLSSLLLPPLLLFRLLGLRERASSSCFHCLLRFGKTLTVLFETEGPAPPFLCCDCCGELMSAALFLVAAFQQN